jgi:spore coat protein CotH
MDGSSGRLAGRLETPEAENLGDGSDTPPVQAIVQPQKASGKKDGPSKGKKREADAIFDNPTLLRIQIQIPQSGLSSLRQTRSEKRPRPTVQATIREGNLVYTNVAVHLKGAAGSFRSIDDKPAFTLKFDKFIPDQTFHGLHKISLNNSVQDGTYLCEQISRELFIAAGVPAPRASHGLVELNGRPLGLYVVLEGSNRQFLKRFFDNPDGNLYDGGFCRDIDSRLEVNCGSDPANHSGLRALRAAVRNPSYERLQQVLDMDRFLSMVALEVMLSHWDGYTFNRNNWRIFHDLGSNRMVFIPHGLDQLFDGGRRLGPSQASGVVSKAVLNTTEGRTHYNERLRQIYTNVFNVDAIAARIDELSAGISSAIAETDPKLARSFQQKANSLKRRIIQRGEAVRRELGGPSRSVQLASNGILPSLDGSLPQSSRVNPSFYRGRMTPGCSSSRSTLATSQAAVHGARASC